ncbi:MAG: HYExAFE family protein, partial [Phycisphaerales bacterium]|nr:HYExAFE family protein [Phycisphaerales bacterium]
MSASRRHYERAFEAMLRRAHMPYVLVDDAKRAILEPGARLGVIDPGGHERRLKSFDAVVYGPRRHALVEVKGRRVDLRKGGAGRRESWATMDDVRSLSIW